MERKIKFRGMTIGGEWVCGNLNILEKKLQNVEAGYYISNKAGSPFAFHVRPETVGQLVIAKDYEHNHTCMDIFEGDIVKDWNGKHEIKFEIFDDQQGYHLELDDAGIEIIGTIYENPELLK